MPILRAYFVPVLSACMGLGPLTAQAGAASFSPLPAEPRNGLPRVIVLPKAGSLVDWPQYGFDSGHSGYNPLEKTLTAANVSTLQEVWSFSAGGTNPITQVIEVQGTLVATSSSGTLFALDASTGDQLWTYDALGAGSDIAADQGLVFTLCGNATRASKGICAISLLTGQLLWSYAHPGTNSHAVAAPVVSDGAAVYGTCFSGVCGLTSLDELTGQVRWSHKAFTDICGLNDNLPSALVNGMVYIAGGCPNGIITGVDASTGHREWQWEGQGGAIQGLSATSSAIYVQANGLSEYKLTGRPRWISESLGQQLPSEPATVGDDVFALNTASGSDLVAYRTGGGIEGRPVELWVSIAGKTSPSVANHVVYSGCAGVPCAFASDTGVLLWSHKTGAITGVPIIVNGAVYAPCETSHVCAWALPSQIRRREIQEARAFR